MSSRLWRPALLIVIAAVGGTIFLAPHRVATKTVHETSLVVSAAHALAAPADHMKIAPAEAGRDFTEWRVLVGDQSAD